MSKINEMIKELCPNGVERVKLGEVCTFKRGITITAKNAIDGDIPVIAGGQKPSYYHNQSNRNGETITVAGSGAYAGFVSFWNTPIWLSDAFSVDPCEKLLPKYVFQFLKLNQQRIIETQKGAGVPHVHGKDISNFEIPLPPLPIQQEIVNILDKFSSLIDNLDETIQLRQKQYEYYREKLLTFEDGECLSVPLGEMSVINTGCKPEEIHEFAEYKYINAGTSESGFCSRFNSEGDCITTPSRGQGGIGFVGYQKQKFWCGPLCYRIKTDERCVNKYAYYYLSCHNELILQFKFEGGTPALNRKDLMTISIPLPPLHRQQEIVATLDKFEAIISNLKQERELRQKQYEYYREKLLTFE